MSREIKLALVLTTAFLAADWAGCTLIRRTFVQMQITHIEDIILPETLWETRERLERDSRRAAQEAIHQERLAAIQQHQEQMYRRGVQDFLVDMEAFKKEIDK